MKQTLLLLLEIVFATDLPSQDTCCLTGYQRFDIVVFSTNAPDSVALDYLVFDAGNCLIGQLEGFGFSGASYQSENIPAGVKFKAVFESAGNGIVVCFGEITGNAIAGKYIWARKGADDLSFSFSGELAKTSAQVIE